ncbi:hypothetical protein BJX61DRAFT_477031 [Aspergillus egyptiacus]|nr:hypothetical protein BJX61DRAFT_477031 [Aspergillus egyptiacus]
MLKPSSRTWSGSGRTPWQRWLMTIFECSSFQDIYSGAGALNRFSHSSLIVFSSLFFSLFMVGEAGEEKKKEKRKKKAIWRYVWACFSWLTGRTETNPDLFSIIASMRKLDTWLVILPLVLNGSDFGEGFVHIIRLRMVDLI